MCIDFATYKGFVRLKWTSRFKFNQILPRPSSFSSVRSSQAALAGIRDLHTEEGVNHQGPGPPPHKAEGGPRHHSTQGQGARFHQVIPLTGNSAGITTHSLGTRGRVWLLSNNGSGTSVFCHHPTLKKPLSSVRIDAAFRGSNVSTLPVEPPAEFSSQKRREGKLLPTRHRHLSSTSDLWRTSDDFSRWKVKIGRSQKRTCNYSLDDAATWRTD